MDFSDESNEMYDYQKTNVINMLRMLFYDAHMFF